MKINKAAIAISSVLVLLALAAWIYFIKSPAGGHNQDTGMGNMDMGTSNRDINTSEADSTKTPNISLNTLLQPTNGYAVSNIQAITLKSSTQRIEINALGHTEYNTNEVGAISARISGRIEKLYVQFRYQLVNKGQKIMDVYSPELLTAQQNLLFLLKNDSSNYSLINAAKQKLVLLGFQGQQLQQVINTQKTTSTIAVFSRYTGHIHEASNMNSGVADLQMSESTTLTTQDLNLKEGMYIQKGQTVFKVYNPRKIWVLLNIYPSDQALVKAGNKVKITAEAKPDKSVQSSINFIEPFFRSESKTLTARVNVNNSVLQLPIGSQVKATIFSRPVNAQWLPKDALLSLGLEKVVFLRSGKGYKAHKVMTGLVYKNLVQITGGISPVDSVADNAQFLMDSESFIKVQIKN